MILILGLQPRDKAAMLGVNTIEFFFSRSIYMKIEFTSQRREMLLFLTTNTAAVTSPANQQCVFFPLSCSFGPDMSIRWLQSLCFSLLESILISQPIMVLLFVFLNLFASYDDGFLLSGEKPEVPITRTSFLDKETFARVYEKN